ncbi:class A beta-lactamase [Sandarakinorhabdus limnophila]|uniref:class A beta-lactamase n=1 Tax=Sandarakinorhabdus limnophila TaxID=210512 RepID=UPI0026EF1C37|nr:class A beta-lactamase [Sandarakinorhabdus limnophila]MCM0033460.1 class A beta-lactamase [Sandarakinorhabdus limnophila]
MIDRRMLMTGLPLLAAAAPDRFAPLRRAIPQIERSAGGPIGISLLDTHTGERFGHRANDRFPLCSTFKLLLAARLLRGADKGQWAMTERVPVTKADMLFNAPFTEKRIGGTASLLELAEAMTVLSDNPAANIALAKVGGPAALTAWLRSIADQTTRIDRNEPEMNNETPGDPRDTSTPAAMLATSRALVEGRILSPAARKTLFGWMQASKTADTMIRAALPPGWQEANKTGAGSWRARNIVSVITPPGRKPIWVAAYLFAGKSELAERNRQFVPLGRAIVESVN